MQMPLSNFINLHTKVSTRNSEETLVYKVETVACCKYQMHLIRTGRRTTQPHLQRIWPKRKTNIGSCVNNSITRVIAKKMPPGS